MKNNYIICLFLLFLVYLGCNEQFVMGQPSHDKSAMMLIERLKVNLEYGNILFGHHDDLLNGFEWKYDQNNRLFEQSDIKAVAGDYPAILGFDLGSIEYYGLKFERGNTFAAMTEAIKLHYYRGGIVTVSAHMRNVLTGESAWDTSRDDVVKKIIRDKKTREQFYKVLDLYCDFFSSLVDTTGTRIPILFRPWHESNLSCFWWGTHQCTNRDYKRLWKLSYNYLVKEKGLDNLIWVYSPSEVTSKRVFNKRYPGDAYVDIIGFECYQRLYKNESIEASTKRFDNIMEDGLTLLNDLTKKHGKIGAITECGFASVPVPNWWTNCLLPHLKKHDVAYLYIWGNRYQEKDKVYGPYKGSIDEKDFILFSKTNECVLLDGIK